MPRVSAGSRTTATRVRGWLPLYRLSWRLGLRALVRRKRLREALIRLIVPLDPSRYLELPHAIREVGARPGERVLDLASPKLAAVTLGREGAEVTSVDLFPEEVATWTDIAGHEPNVHFVRGDGRKLAFDDDSFDHAYSISVIEHIPDDGDERALRELARVVRPGGRVVLTMPFAERYSEDWREDPLYDTGDEGAGGRYFFERWYDSDRIERLLATAPELREVHRSVVSMSPDLHRAYTRAFPWLIPLGPLFGLAARERLGPPGGIVRLTLVNAVQ